MVPIFHVIEVSILLTIANRTMTMKESLMEILCCPVDKADLELEIFEQEETEILEGVLTCTECGEEYPIEDGIPNLLPPDMQDETTA